MLLLPPVRVDVVGDVVDLEEHLDAAAAPNRKRLGDAQIDDDDRVGFEQRRDRPAPKPRVARNALIIASCSVDVAAADDRRQPARTIALGVAIAVEVDAGA